MKTILIGINSKFIHTNMAIRYLKANCTLPVELMEYTIKDDINIITKEIKDVNPDIIGFSCYIWNISIIQNILNDLRTNNPNIIIILGGPETSYEYDDYLINNKADYIIFNEGEIAFNKLMDSLSNKTDLSNIPNLAYLKDGKIIKNQLSNIKNLNSLKSPYFLEEDISNIPNKIQYVELSRGCPYQCSYCLASLEKGLRFFDVEKTFFIIDYLIEKGAKTIKFLDRSFNANKQIALNFFKKLVEKDYPTTIFQFEINGDVIDDLLIDFFINNLKKNYVRLELGVQSTNDQVNKAVRRIQDTPTLINNIKKLQKSNAILHLDLIAGLPFEDLDSFKNTFNEIFSLYSEELQLGFLKMLKGTKIRRESSLHNYTFSYEPPYEITENKYLSKNDLMIIHQVEVFLEIYWNKSFMNNTIMMIMENTSNPFNFFLELSNYFKKHNYDYKKYQLFDLFVYLRNYLIDSNIINKNIEDSLKLDYLKYNKIKPKIYWDKNIKKQDIIRKFHLNNPDLNLDQLYKYSLVTNYKDGYLIALYFPNKKDFFYYSDNKTKRISA
ncbi:MAG: radical SAM protein [Candidatus Izemoplasmatales bacterium]